MELYSMLCGSLDGRGVWGRKDTSICMAESLACTPETITTLLIGYTSYETTGLKKKKKKTLFFNENINTPCLIIENFSKVSRIRSTFSGKF